jgi:uncharacterized membrane protein YhaH (DUF805 family)
VPLDVLKLNAPYPRYWYVIAVPVCGNVPLGASIRGRAWIYVAVLVSALVYVTARRFVDIQWPRWWAVPYSLLSLSPYALLYRYPHMSLALVTIAVIVLQSPVAFRKARP